MSTRTEELRYLWRLDLADDVTGPLLKATREQERALAVQEKALKKVGDTSGRVSKTQKTAAKTVADAAGLRAREAARAADREVQSLTRTGKSYQQLSRDAQQAARQQEQAARRAQAAMRAEQRTAQTARDDIKRAGRTATAPVRTGATALTAAAGFGVGALVANYVSFEKQLSRVRAVTAATDDEFKRLQATALDLGQKTAFNNREVAAAMTELATAGFSVDQVIKTLPGTLNLASATGYDLAASAELQASALRGFGLEGKDATRVADVLTNTANQSAVGMDDLAESLKYIAPVAKASGQGMENMLSAVGLLGNVGIKGSQAGTTLRTALVRLQAPTEKVQGALDKLKISGNDLYGPNGLKPLPEILGKIVTGAQGMDKSTRNAALAHIFGREALSGMVTLVEAGEGKYRKFQRALEHSDGAAKKSAETMRDNVAGSWDQFTGSVESAAAALLTKFSPAVQDALTDAGDFVDGLVGAEPKRTITRSPQGRVTGVKVSELNDATRAGKEFAKTLEQINDGAQDIIGPLSKFAGWAVDIGRANPWIVKTLGSLIALRIAWKAIKITSAGTGLTGFLKTLNRVGGADGVGLGGRIINGIRGKIANGGGPIRSTLSRVLGRAGTSAGTVAAENVGTSLTANSGKVRTAASTLGKIGGAAFRLALNPYMIAAAAGVYTIWNALHDSTFAGDPATGGLPTSKDVQATKPPSVKKMEQLFPISNGRKGGIVGRFQDGGMVPAYVSSGEEVHHAGQVWTVPGAPTAADNVFAMLPMGAAVVTFDGQARMAAGASLGEAIATQAPHFKDGGFVVPTSKTHQYTVRELVGLNLFHGWKGENAAIGAATVMGESGGKPWAKGQNSDPQRSWDRGLWMINNYWNKDVSDAVAFDPIPATRVARRLWRQRGWNPWYAWKNKNQPYVANLPKAQAAVRELAGQKITLDGRSVTSDGSPTSSSSSSKSSKPRVLSRNRGRQGILRDALEQGITAGREGRRTARAAGALSSIQQAAKITPRTTTTSKRRSPTASTSGTVTDGAVTYDGHPIAGWIKPHLDYLRGHGWRGRVSDGVRSYERQRQYYQEMLAGKRKGPVAKPGESNHRGTKYPLGAVDLTDQYTAARLVPGSKSRPGPLKWYGPKDSVHFSAKGNRRGGIIGYRGGGKTAKRAPYGQGISREEFPSFARVVWDKATAMMDSRGAMPPIKRGGTVRPGRYAWFDGKTGRITTTRSMDRAMANPRSRDHGYALQTLIHEFAHARQRADVINGPAWQREGGADSFANWASRRILPALGIKLPHGTGWGYPAAGLRVHKEKGDRWWKHDQFARNTRGFQRGGLVGNFQNGGSTLRGATHAAVSLEKGSLSNLDGVLAEVAERRLIALRARMLREARKGGEEKVVKRYQSIVSLIDVQLGLRIGRLQAGIERRTERTTFVTDLTQRRLRGRGIDPAGTQGLQVTARTVDQFEIPAAKANLRDARIALRKAVRAGASKSRQDELQQAVTDAIADLDETLVTQIERRRQIIQSRAQDLVTSAQATADWNTAGLAFLDASQRVQGTAGTSEGMRQRANTIEQSLPALKYLQDALTEQGNAALRTGDVAGWRQAMQAAQAAATDLANAQADAGELIKQAAYKQVQDTEAAANFASSVTQAQLESLTLQQQQAGTFDTATGRQQRATFIRETIIPALQAELKAAQEAVTTARQQDGESSEEYRAAVLKALGLQNEIAKDNLDATQTVAENTEQLKEFSGSTAFENRGQQEVLGLLGVGSGT